uniref:Uncharacterized protein n=1 Tax=Rhizophora mucronata TaxID=61149 RepID=A0A2P2NEJ6_RHIMU
MPLLLRVPLPPSLHLLGLANFSFPISPPTFSLLSSKSSPSTSSLSSSS